MHLQFVEIGQIDMAPEINWSWPLTHSAMQQLTYTHTHTYL